MEPFLCCVINVRAPMRVKDRTYRDLMFLDGATLALV